MLTVIVTLRVRPGANEQLEADYRAWADVVKREEPGTLFYSLCRSRQESNTYHAIEQYENEEAMNLHVSNWMARKEAPDTLAEPPSVTIHDTISAT